MKRQMRIRVATILAATFLALLPAAEFGRFKQIVTLHWAYEADDVTDDLVFHVYSSTNIAVPLTNWTVYITAPGTNRSVTLPAFQERRFFFMTASNLWGEANPSVVLAAPPLPRSPTNALRLDFR